MAEIVTIGETMAALAPKAAGYLHYMKDYEMHIAGAESNLAIGVCKLGHTAGWISSLGDDELGYYVRNNIRAEGVDTSYVKLDAQHRTGVMFKQVLTGKETSVFYYRENSAASHMEPAFLKEEMFEGAKILHLTGITPVLSESCEQMVQTAVSFAAAAGAEVSFDPNIRRKLWKDRDYTPVLREIMDSSSILMLGLDEAETLYGTREKEEIAERFFEKKTAKYLAVKDGGNGALVADRSGSAFIEPYPCKVVDPIGAGDAFNAAFLCGILEGKTLKEAGLMAGIAGALATESYGDIEGYPTREVMQRTLAEISGSRSREIFR